MKLRKETMHSTDTDLAEELRELAVSIGVRAAEVARFRRGDGIDVAYSKTAVADIVTEGDRETERFIRDAVARARTEDGFLGEEFDPVPSKNGITWVVDPIDGTVNYLYGLAPCAVSIAVVQGDPTGEDWTVLAGAVVSVFDRHVYSASPGKGAFLDGVRLQASATVDLPITLACTGLAYLPEVRVKQARVLERLLAEVRDIRRIGCASLELCALAAGQVDFYYDRGLKPWDYMAGTLIAREAGALVRGRGGREQPSTDLAVGGNARLLEELQPRLERWLADEGL